MPYAHPPFSLSLLERAVASLDAKVLDVLAPLGFSNSPQRWSDQLAGLFADRYRLRVQGIKDTIRAVAQEFRGMGRTEHLLQGGRDIVQRTDMLRSMLAALEVLTSREFHPPGIQSTRLDRLQEYFPTFRAAISTIAAKTSRWQDDFREWQAVFNTLEKPVGTIQLLLHFLPATIPDAHVSEGREVIEMLVALWNIRRQVIDEAHRLMSYEELEDPRHLMECLDAQHEDQPFPISLFMDVVNKLDNLPPLYLPSRDFAARQFLEAEVAFKRLCSEHASISEDISRLVCIFDHFMGLVDNAAAFA